MKLNRKISVGGKCIKIFSYHESDCEDDDNLDIFVEIDGDTYSGQVYSIGNVNELLGKSDMPCYFFDRNGIVIKNITEECILDAVKRMIMEGELAMVFCKQVR